MAAAASPAVRDGGWRRDVAGDEGTNAGNVLLAFLVGALSGAAVALLYAPKSGRETREYIGEKARESRARAVDAAAKGRDVLNQGRETITTAIERGREAYQQAKSRDSA
jgi:gas vesicle protein